MNLTTKTAVEILRKLNSIDLEDLCDATVDTMKETLGFNIGTQNIQAMNREAIASYWEGVLLVPERVLIVGRLDNTIAGALQIVKPSQSNHISSFSCSIDNHFVAPWARGHGLSNMMLELSENEAKRLGYTLIRISVRKTRDAAIKVFEKRGYQKWGELPKYELDQGKVVPGYFYFKEL